MPHHDDRVTAMQRESQEIDPEAPASGNLNSEQVTDDPKALGDNILGVIAPETGNRHTEPDAENQAQTARRAGSEKPVIDYWPETEPDSPAER